MCTRLESTFKIFLRIKRPLLCVGVLFLFISAGFNDLAIAGNNKRVNTPVITPNGGTFSESVEVRLSTTTKDATIRYTTDGSEPTNSSWTYKNPFVLNSNKTVKVSAYKKNYKPSRTVSASFKINRGDVFKRGDVNGDGKVTPGDALLVYQYTKGQVQFTDQQKKAADGTLNGTITVKDSMVIFDYSLGKIDRFANFGDANLDGIVSGEDATAIFNYFLNGKTPTPTHAYVSDVNADGVITPGDALLVAQFVKKEIKEFPTDPQYGKGDVNQNETVTPGDSQLIEQYLTGATVLSETQEWSAEVTGNNLISRVDSTVIFDYYLGKLDRLPIRFGDADLDGKVTTIDADLTYKFFLKTVNPSSTQAYVSDVNGDGVITPGDALLITQFVNGTITEFPVDPSTIEPPVCGNGICEKGEDLDICPQCLQEPCPCYSCPKDCPNGL